MVFIKILYTIIILVLIIAPSTVVLGLLGIILSIFSKNLAHYCEKIFFKIILFASFVKVKIIGKEYIENRRYIIIANHQSNFDIPVISASLPLQVRWISKSSIFKIPIIGQFMDAIGYISLPKENPIKSTETFMKRSQGIDGFPVIFPEGTRSRTGEIQKFKRGFIVLSEKLNLGLLPIVIDGTQKIMPRGKLYITPFQKVTLKILKPIDRETINNSIEFVSDIENLFIENLNILRRGV